MKYMSLKHFMLILLPLAVAANVFGAEPVQEPQQPVAPAPQSGVPVLLPAVPAPPAVPAQPVVQPQDTSPQQPTSPVQPVPAPDASKGFFASISDCVSNNWDYVWDHKIQSTTLALCAVICGHYAYNQWLKDKDDEEGEDSVTV